MNSYTHCGAMQSARRNTPEFIEPNYTEEEIVEVINFSTMISLLAALEISHISKSEKLAIDLFEKIQEFAKIALTT